MAGLGTGLGQSHLGASEALAGLGTRLGQSHLGANEAFKNMVGLGTSVKEPFLDVEDETEGDKNAKIAPDHQKDSNSENNTLTETEGFKPKKIIECGMRLGSEAK